MSQKPKMTVPAPVEVTALVYTTDTGHKFIVIPGNNPGGGTAECIPVLGSFTLAAFAERMCPDQLSWFFECSIKAAALRIANRFLGKE